MTWSDSAAILVISVTSFCAVPFTIWCTRWVRTRFQDRTARKKKSGPAGVRSRLNQYIFIDTYIGAVLDASQVAFSLLACGLYVAETYQSDDEDQQRPFFIAEVTLTAIFAVDYLLRFYLAKDKWVYFFGPIAIVDFVTVVPALLVLMLFSAAGGVSFLRVLRLLRALRVLRVLKIFRIFSMTNSGNSSELTVQALKVCFTALCLIFACACFFAQEENLDFHVAFYFMTIETLGRPNIPCNTAMGYTLLYSIVVIGYIFLPKQLADLSSTWARKQDHLNVYNARPGRGHVVLCGSITFQVLRDTLKDVVTTFVLSAENDIQDVIVLSDQEPSRFMLGVIEACDGASSFHQGNMLALESMNRVSLTEARFVLLFSDSSVVNEQAEDFITLSRFMALKAVAPNMPVCTLVLHEGLAHTLESYPTWNRATDSVVCWSTARMGMLTANCVAPGTSVLLTELFAPRVDPTEYTGVTLSNMHTLSLDEYAGFHFVDLVGYFYEHCGNSVLFAREDEDGMHLDTLTDHIVKNGEIGVFVCSSTRMAKRIELGMQDALESWLKIRRHGGFDVNPLTPLPPLSPSGMTQEVSRARADQKAALQAFLKQHYDGSLQRFWMDATSIPSSASECHHFTAQPNIGEETKPGTKAVTTWPLVFERKFGLGSWSKRKAVPQVRLPGRFGLGEPAAGTEQLDGVAGEEDEDGYESVRENELHAWIEGCRQDPAEQEGPSSPGTTAPFRMNGVSNESFTRAARNPTQVLICGWSQEIMSMLCCLLVAGKTVSVVANVEESRMDKVREQLVAQRGVGQRKCDEHLQLCSGSPTEPTLLLACGVVSCETAIVLSPENFFETGLGDDVDDFLQDTDSVATFNLLQVYAPKAHITVELQDTNSCTLLNDKTRPGLITQFLQSKPPTNIRELMASRQFNSGAVFVPALVHLLLVQAASAPIVTRVFTGLFPRVISGKPFLPVEKVPVPQELEDCCYGDFFQRMLAEHKLVLMGLMAAESDRDLFSFEAAVRLNPEPATLLTRSMFAYGIRLAQVDDHVHHQDVRM